MLSGQAGIGKTHLIVSELRSVAPATLTVLIWSPPQLKEFGPWLDEQFVASLLETEVSGLPKLRSVSLQLIKTAFGERRSKRLLDRLAEMWGGNIGREVFDAIRGVGRGLPFGEAIDSALAIPFKSRESFLRDAAKTMARALQLGEGARDFCAALLLYQTSLKPAAIHWLSHKTTPEELRGWRKSAPFSTFELISKALAQLKRGLLVCFDQLELMTLDQRQTRALALTQLFQEAFQLLRNHTNLVCVISALTDIAEKAIENLPNSDFTRVRGGEQKLSGLPVREALAFMGPRIEAIEQVDPQAALIVSRYVEWASRTKLLAVRVTPRLLLRGAKECLKRELQAESVSETDFEKVWNDVGRLVGREETEEAKPAGPKNDGDDGNDVEALWQKIVSEGGRGQLFPTEATAVLRLIRWAVESVGPSISGIGRIEKLSMSAEAEAVSFEVVAANDRATDLSTVFIANNVKFGKDLKRRLEQISRSRAQGRRVVLRTADTFPGQRTQAGAVLAQLKAKGFERVEIEEQELMLLSRLQLLDRLVSKKVFEEWVANHLLSLSGTRNLLGV